MSRNNWIWIFIIVLFVGSIGAVLFNRFGIPMLATVPGLSWIEKLESSNPVVINRYQEVQLNEGANLIDLSKQAAVYTVSIYSAAPNLKFLGNGIVASADGMVLASKANLPAAGSVTVVLNDGSNYTGLIRALDPRSELAVLTIDAKNLPFAQFADAQSLTASQRLIFLGRSNNSFTHDFSLGQISRSVGNGQSLDHVFSSDAFENTIQVAVKLTPDYIGGPVIDLNGKIVGLTKSDLGVLIGEDLSTAVSSFLQTGKIQRPTLGIKYLNLSDELGKLKNLRQGGILVTNVDAGSNAQKGGILASDLIVTIDNQDLPANNFEKILNQHGLTNMPVTVLRNNNKINLTINLETK